MRYLLLFTVLVVSSVASKETMVSQNKSVPKLTLKNICKDTNEVILSFLDLQDYATYSSLNTKNYQNFRDTFFLLCSYRLLYGFSTKFQFTQKNRQLASQILLENILSQYIQTCKTPKTQNWIIFQYRKSEERPLKPKELIEHHEGENTASKHLRLHSYIYNPKSHAVYRTHKHFHQIRKPEDQSWIYTASSPMPLFIHYSLFNGHRYDFLARYINFRIETVNYRIKTIICQDTNNPYLYREFQFMYNEILNVMTKVKLIYIAGGVEYVSRFIIEGQSLIPETPNYNSLGFGIYQLITSSDVFKASPAKSINKRIREDEKEELKSDVK